MLLVTLAVAIYPLTGNPGGLQTHSVDSAAQRGIRQEGALRAAITKALTTLTGGEGLHGAYIRRVGSPTRLN